MAYMGTHPELTRQFLALRSRYGWGDADIDDRVADGRIRAVRQPSGKYVLVVQEDEPPAEETLKPLNPLWYIACLFFPITIFVYIVYKVIQGLNPFSNPYATSAYDDDGDDMSFARREQMQWLLGTGQYADRD